jgi:hypothetical protein
MPDFTLELWKLAFEPHGNFRFEEIIDDAMVKWGLAPKMGACRSERLVSHEHPNLVHVNRAVGSLVGNALGYGTVIGTKPAIVKSGTAASIARRGTTA